jgi:NADH-quinone oxidoreductase subunit C
VTDTPPPEEEPVVASAADPQPEVSEAEPPKPPDGGEGAADISQSRPAEAGTAEARPEETTPSADTPAEPVGDEPEPAPEPTEEERQAAELFARLEQELGDVIVDHAVNFGDLIVRVRRDGWRRAAEVARDRLGCDYLSFVSGIDWLPAPTPGGEEAGGDTSSPVQPKEMTFGAAGSDGRFQVFANVLSTTHHITVTFKTDVDENDPRVASWTPVYAGADWHERECWEMFGIDFDGHPAMRKLYLPSGFEGHPLRKDFPLLAREIKPWPGLVDVEPMPGEESGEGEGEAE